MKELIFEYISATFYIPEYMGSLTENTGKVLRFKDNSKLGYAELESLLKITFNLSDDLAHAITFNWLLASGVELIKENWNRSYRTQHNGFMGECNVTSTEEIDITYMNE